MYAIPGEVIGDWWLTAVRNKTIYTIMKNIATKGSAPFYSTLGPVDMIPQIPRPGTSAAWANPSEEWGTLHREGAAKVQGSGFRV